jgi:voltage-gated potassium channel Kch
MKLRQLFRSLQKQIINRPLTAVLFLLIFIYFCATLIIMAYEKVGLGEATTIIMPAFLGELGTVESGTIITRISILAALLVSVAFLAVITAKITTEFIEFCRRGGSMVKKANLSNHIIIAGWNFQGERIICELLKSGAKSHREIVILANCDQRPVKNERVDFVKGDPTQDEDLIRAGIKKAKSVIVLSDLTKNANEADAEALMIVLAVESLNRDVHSCVQILNSANRIHLERAHADEIICLDQMGGNLIVASAINQGISRVVNELLTFNSGSEFYRYDGKLSDSLVGKEFADAVQLLAEKKMILLALETDDTQELRESLPDDTLHSVEDGTKVIVVNPQCRYHIRQGDALFLISESKPNKL